MIHEPLNPFALRTLGMLKRCALLARRPSLQAVRFRPPADPGSPALVYLGEGESLDYLAAGLLPGWGAEAMPAVSVGSLKSTINRLRAEKAVVLTEINRLLAPLLPPGGHLSYPWIRQVARIDQPQWRRRAARNLVKYHGLVDRHGYAFSTTRERAAVDRFHQQLYLPYVNFRFGPACHPRTPAEFARWARAGFLLEVGRAGQTVAGAICWRRGPRLATCAWGVAPDFADNLQRGALGAAYHHIFATLAPRDGIAVVDLVRSRAHAGDGVYRHKAAWGATPQADPWPHLLWRLHLPRNGRFPAELAAQLVRVGDGFQRLADLAIAAE